MATVVATQASERGANQVVLTSNTAHTTATTQDHQLQLPVGFGDCLILEVHVSVTGEATALPASADTGIIVFLNDIAGVVADVVGVSRVLKDGAAAHAAQITPDGLIVWHQAENLRFFLPAVDTNIAPTATINFFARVRRLRDEPPSKPIPRTDIEFGQLTL